MYANAAVNAESSKSAAEYANDWLEYLKDTPQANEIFKSLERIARLEERKHYLCDSFDVSFWVFLYDQAFSFFGFKKSR